MQKQMILALVIVAGTISQSVGQIDQFRTVALSGTQAQGLAPGVNYTPFFRSFHINDAGQTIFSSLLTGTDVTFMNREAIFSDVGGSGMTVIARTGNQALGLAPGVNYDSLYGVPSSSLNNAGQIAFQSSLTGSNNNEAIFVSEFGGANLTATAQTGDQAHGLAPGVSYDGFFRVNSGLNNAGHIMFTAPLFGPGVSNVNDSAIFSNVGGSGLTAIIREGDQAPGLNPRVKFGEGTSFEINGNGQMAFIATLTGAFVTGLNNGAIFSDVGGSGLTSIAREGDQVPGLAPGVIYDNFFFGDNEPVINDAGQIMFSASLTRPGMTVTGDGAILSNVGGSGLKVIARVGDQAPGLAPGVEYDAGFITPALSNAGQMAFSSRLDGAGVTSMNDFAIFSDVGGLGLTAIVREGDQATGLAAGVIYSGFRFSGYDNDPKINDAGQMAFSARLTDDNLSFFSGLFAIDENGTTILITAEGELFDVNNDPFIDDFRTISSLGDNFELNNSGELLFNATFTDGTGGLFVATIPAPGSAVIFFTTIGMLAARRRRTEH